MTDRQDRLEALLQFPLMSALFGRRARRFGMGMETPSGPLAFRSEREAMPLSERTVDPRGSGHRCLRVELRRSLRPRTPESHAEFTLRFTGERHRRQPVSVPAIFFTDDEGCYCTRTRDVQPGLMRS